MKIGIISDTHDNVPKVKEAVTIFNEEGVDLVIHAGDYIAPFAVAPLNNLKCDYVGVFGNNDGEKLGLNRVSQGRIKQKRRMWHCCWEIPADGCIKSVNPLFGPLKLWGPSHRRFPRLQESTDGKSY